jgi:alkylated DNA nucleotide flippase Atl1/TfoX/Sxy family transcriptional regulator of competence genes
MFGEYALYANGITVALICDNQLYVKILDESELLAEYCEQDTPFKGAKLHYLIEEDQLTSIDDLPDILISIAERLIQEKRSKKENTSPAPGSFSERVIKIAQNIPFGKVATYGDIARAAGGASPVLAQSITHILGKAYQNGVTDIPFHRIVYSDGRIWTNSEYDTERLTLYKKEGIDVNEKGRITNFQEIRIHFK